MQRLALILAALFVSAATYFLHARLDEIQLLEPDVELETLPSIASLKLVSLGYDSLVADYYWMRSLEHFGTASYHNRAYPLLEPLLRRALSLDPYFKSAYLFAGQALTLRGMDTRKADALLEQGLTYRPDVWQIAYYLGFNLYYFEGNYGRAAEVLTLASQHPEAPPLTAQLATRIAARAGQPQIGIQLIDSILERTRDEQLRATYIERKKALRLEVELQYLSKLVQRYKDEQGHPPKQITDLVRGGYLTEPPSDPFGKPYRLEQNGAPISDSDNMRLRLGRRAESDRSASGWYPPLLEDAEPVE